MDEERTVVAVHLSLGLAPPTARTIGHWTNALASGSMTEADLRAALVRGDAYRVSVRTRFRDACYALLGEADDDAFDDAFSRGVDAMEVSDADISRAVRLTSKFASRYADVVRSHFARRGGESPPETFVTEMVSRFRDDPTFDVDALRLVAWPPGAAAAAPEKVESAESGTQTPSSAPAPAHPSSTWKDRDDPQVRRMLDAGDRYFGRPWYATEFLVYGPSCACLAARELDAHVDALHADHTSGWEVARDAHASLLGDSLTEMDFVRTYVGRHALPGFEAAIRAEILASDGYERRVVDRLVAVQARLYGTELGASEIASLFALARAVGSGVTDDEISPLLHAHRRESDALASEVVSVYVDVLGREPDAREIVEDVEGFRASGAVALGDDRAALARARGSLSCRLSRGFEFHDVVKTRLHTAYVAQTGSQLSLHTKYVLLERVLGIVGLGGAPGDGHGGWLATIIEGEISRITR